MRRDSVQSVFASSLLVLKIQYPPRWVGVAGISAHDVYEGLLVQDR